MAKRVALNVSLTRELADFIRAEVASGQYGTASEVVRTSLRMLAKARHARRNRAIEDQPGETRDA